MLHPHLLPAVIGAVVGLALIVWASLQLFKRWSALTPRARWFAFASIALFEAAYWLNIYAWFVEPNLLVVRRIDIASPYWSGAPIRIAALSDTHVGGPHVNAARMQRVVARVNSLRPDLVVLLGDYVGGHDAERDASPALQQEVSGGVATFAALNARYGAVAVLGNHDSWYNRQSITTALQDAGVAALWNRHVVIRRSGGPIVLAGIADDWTGDPDLEAALDGAPQDADTIVLSHSPDPFDEMPPGPALMIAAHTHCGQVTIPFVGRPLLPVRNKAYACGLVRRDDRILYVTGGIGTSIAPVRFLNPPEIVLITLSAATPARS